MTRLNLGYLACVFALSIGAVACNGNADVDDNDTARSDSAISGSVGTAGDGADRVAETGAAPQQQGAQDQPDQRGDGDQLARADLPDTASWLPFAGLIGLLSMGGVFGVRLLRRE